MPGAVGGVGRRAFGKCHRQKSVAGWQEPAKLGAGRDRVKNIGMHRITRSVVKCTVDTRRVYLRTQPPMNKPLLKPDGLQGACRYFAQNCSDVWTTKSSESFLSRIGFIWISIIERHIQ